MIVSRYFPDVVPEYLYKAIQCLAVQNKGERIDHANQQAEECLSDMRLTLHPAVVIPPDFSRTIAQLQHIHTQRRCIIYTGKQSRLVVTRGQPVTVRINTLDYNTASLSCGVKDLLCELLVQLRGNVVNSNGMPLTCLLEHKHPSSVTRNALAMSR